MMRNTQLTIAFVVCAGLVLLIVLLDKPAKEAIAESELTAEDTVAEVVNEAITSSTAIVDDKAVETGKNVTDIAAVTAEAADGTKPGNENKQQLTPEEIDSSIGRYGEVVEIPEGFEFSAAEEKLWRTEHLGNVTKPGRLYYEFTKSGSYEEGFTDSVYLDIVRLNEDGTKNTLLEFFSGERKQQFSADNVNNITGNPVVGIYMQGDIMEMDRLTDGHWRHFQKMIKIALRTAKVEPISFEFNGIQYQGDKISFSPYLNDPHRNDFIKFADKHYEFIMSEKIPGMLYQIHTVIPDNSKQTDSEAASRPLVEETLTLVEINFSN